MHQATADEHKELAAIIAHTIAIAEGGAKTAGEKAEAAKERAARIKRGENVPGGLGKQPTQEDFRRILREGGGVTKRSSAPVLSTRSASLADSTS
jgi:hypothetical protein